MSLSNKKSSRKWKLTMGWRTLTSYQVQCESTLNKTVNKSAMKTVRRRILRRIKEDGCRASLKSFPTLRLGVRSSCNSLHFLLSNFTTLEESSTPEGLTLTRASPITPFLPCAVGSFNPLPSVSILTVTPSSNSSRRAVRVAAPRDWAYNPRKPFVLDHP